MSRQTQRPTGTRAAALLAAMPVQPPLLDVGGEPFPPTALPCAQLADHGDLIGDLISWEEDATIVAQRHAAKLCMTSCAGLAACYVRATELGELARGVWAGVVPKRATGYVPAVYDATVASWLHKSGTEVGQPR